MGVGMGVGVGVGVASGSSAQLGGESQVRCSLLPAHLLGPV